MVLVEAGCGGSGPSEPEGDEARHGAESTVDRAGGMPDTLDYNVETEVVARDLVQPWSIDFLGPDAARVTEQSGWLRLMVEGKLRPDSFRGTPEVYYSG